MFQKTSSKVTVVEGSKHGILYNPSAEHSAYN